jgi:peroxiredoxin
MMIEPGQTAPDAEVVRADDSTVAISSFWQTRHLIVTFLRHFGCSFCRAFITQLRAAYPEIVARNGAVVAISQGLPAQADYFVRAFTIPFPVLADPGRQAYRAYGLDEAPLAEVLNPAVAFNIARTALHGHLPGAREHLNGVLGREISLKQFGGTFVIERGGIVRYAYLAQPVYRMPAVNDLLHVLDTLPPRS